MSESRSIPSLDGLRAIAIATVVLGHSRSAFLDAPWFLPFRNGPLGVVGFFVLSGFLITGILLKEVDKTGQIDFKRFYARRAFRIFPAFYFYLIVIVCLGLAHVVSLDWTSVLVAGTYTWNYFHASQSTLAQMWSLSLEEQFYLLWPLCLFFFRKRMCLYIALGSIVVEPFIRVATYALFPAVRGNINMMLHTHIDAILTGSAIAIALNLKLYTGLLTNLSKARWSIISALYFIVQPYLKAKFGGSFTLPIGMTLDELCWGAVLLHVTQYPQLPVGKFLNWRIVKHLGMISYSVYLWQQLFVGDDQHSPFPLNVVWILLCAEGSFWLIEQPFLRLRDRVVSRPVAALKPSDEALVESV